MPQAHRPLPSRLHRVRAAAAQRRVDGAVGRGKGGMGVHQAGGG